MGVQNVLVVQAQRGDKGKSPQKRTGSSYRQQVEKAEFNGKRSLFIHSCKRLIVTGKGICPAKALQMIIVRKLLE